MDRGQGHLQLIYAGLKDAGSGLGAPLSSRASSLQQASLALPSRWSQRSEKGSRRAQSLWSIRSKRAHHYSRPTGELAPPSLLGRLREGRRGGAAVLGSGVEAEGITDKAGQHGFAKLPPTFTVLMMGGE